MAIRKSDTIADESNSKYAKSKSAVKIANITERFDDSTDNDNPYDDVLQYVNKKIDEVIDQVNLDEAKSTNVTTNLSVASSTGARVIASSDGTNATLPIATTSVSGVMSTAIFDAVAANTAKNTNADQSKSDINALDITEVGTISSGVWQGTAIAQAYIAGDAINGDKIADNAINSEHYTDGSIDTDHIADNQVTADKLADSINTAIAANTNKTVLVVGTGSGNAKAGNTTTISSGQASAISANTSKVGFVTTMPTATESVTCTLTATKNRGVINALVFTVIDSSGRTPVTKTATIDLE